MSQVLFYVTKQQITTWFGHLFCHVLDLVLSPQVIKNNIDISKSVVFISSSTKCLPNPNAVIDSFLT